MLRICLLILALWPQDQGKPLPEVKPFLEAFRKTLHSDRTLLRQYTFDEKETEIRLDGKGQPTKTEERIYHVMPGLEQRQTYRKLISKDGKELSQKELDKEDRDEQNRIEKEDRKYTQKERDKDDREEQKTLDDVFSMYDVQFLNREVIDGETTILATFKSKPDFKPKTDDGKLLQHIAGRVWVSESDHQLVKLEAEVVDPISVGAGILAKLQKGSTVTFQRRKVNNEVWLPMRVEVSLNARVLLLKGFNIHEITAYSNHKKYTVDTILKFGTPAP